MGKTSEVPTANAYAVVPEKEQEIPAYTVAGTAATAVELDQPASNVVAEEFTGIPETNGLSWRDDFFEGGDFEDDGIIAVFDFDYENMESHYRCVGWSLLGFFSVCCPSTIPWILLSLLPCNLNRNVRWNVRSQHIALTRTGILFVHDQRPACWGESCCTIRKRSQFIPYDRITECTVSDGNNRTCAVNNELTVVEVHTDTSVRNGLKITGLKDPFAFQKLAMSLKQNGGNVNTATATGRLAMVIEDRGIQEASSNSGEVAVLLREIRDELRLSNNNVRGTSEPTETVATSAPVEPSAPPANQDE